MKILYKIWPRTAYDNIEIWPFESFEIAFEYVKKEYKKFNFTDEEIKNLIIEYQIKELFEKDYKWFNSIDLYNMLLKKENKDKNIIAKVLKDRWEIDLLYSLYINN